jgi:VanZ family protein
MDCVTDSQIQAVRHQLSFQVICTGHFRLQTSRNFLYIYINECKWLQMACLVSCLLVEVVQLTFSGRTCLLSKFFKDGIKKYGLV